MGLAAKNVFIKNLSQKLSDTLTVNEMTQLTSALADELSKFELEQNETNKPDIESRELLEEFLATKEIEGKSPNTISHYRYILTRMFDDINLPVRDIMIFSLRRYLAKLKQSGLQDVTVEGIRCVICSFFGWVHRENLIDVNPAGNLGPIRCEKKVKKPLSDVDIETLKECAANIRDRAIISFLLSTGCRISEVCGLNRDGIDFANLECVVHGKGNKQRTVYIDDVTAMLLKRYLRQRTDDHEALFIGKGTTRLTPAGVRFMLNKLAEEAGVDHVHPHRFRRTLATNLVDHGMPIQEVASILGHEKLETTMKYVFINKTHVKNDYKKYA